MSAAVKFVGIDEAKRLVADLYPDAKKVEYIDHGYDNIVALIDERYAVRFPRNEAALVRNRYEEAMLSKLDAIKAVYTPRFLKRHENPPYLVTTYIAGRHRDLGEIDAFTLDELRIFGQTVGTFAYELHSSLSVEAEQEFRQQAQLGEQFDETWEEYFRRVVRNGKYTTASQRSLAQHYCDQWEALQAAEQEKVVIHDDLHIANMLFEEHRLVGILDFAEANIGTAEQEFRQLYRINLHVLEAAVATYSQLSGKELDTNAIKTWAIMQELGSYGRRLAAGQTDHPSFKRATDHLNQWLPDGNWGEL